LAKGGAGEVTSTEQGGRGGWSQVNGSNRGVMEDCGCGGVGIADSGSGVYWLVGASVQGSGDLYFGFFFAF